MTTLVRWARPLALIALVLALLTTPPARAAGPLDRINHLIVIVQENWSFDSLYGEFPGANGLANAGAAVAQVDKTGQPYASLPAPVAAATPPAADPRFPATLPVQPYDLGRYAPADQAFPDPGAGFYQEQAQIDGGKMDKFAAYSKAPGVVLGYYDAALFPVGRLAQQYTLGDNFFHAAYGGSFLNHQFLICACAPTWPNAPAALRAQLSPTGALIKDGPVTPDGYVVNTAYSVNSPHPATVTDTTHLVPEQTAPTIGDRLSAAGVSWAWYAGGWNDAVAGHPDKLFQPHHAPFAYYANYADGTPGRVAHLRDEQDFLRALTTNDLPAVSFVKPIGADNEHPGYATEQQGQQHVASLIQAVQNSPYWADSAIVVTYDENGGFWDHVAPPAGDRWGPGTRVPLVVISPFAKRGFVDHTQYDTTSIPRTIELRWALAPLGTRDAAAAPLTNAFAVPADSPPAGMPQTGAGGLPPAWGLLGLALLTAAAGLAIRAGRPARARG